MKHYQFIEMHLEGIYAALTGESFYLGLKEVERYSINRIIIMIQKQEKAPPDVEYLIGHELFSVRTQCSLST